MKSKETSKGWLPDMLVVLNSVYRHKERSTSTPEGAASFIKYKLINYGEKFERKDDTRLKFCQISHPDYQLLELSITGTFSQS